MNKKNLIASSLGNMLEWFSYALYGGFAFGIGLTRMAMFKYNIADIRVLNSGDIRNLKQFGTE